MNLLRQLYPHNPSLREEITRLLFSDGHTSNAPGFEPTTAMAGSSETVPSRFPVGGCDRQYRTATRHPGYSPASVIGDTFGPTDDDDVLRPLRQPCQSHACRRDVFSTQDSIKRAILGAAAADPDTTSGSGGARKPKECVFCKNNKEERKLYRSHVIKDRNGKVTCPVLRVYVCPDCHATGDEAHTKRYCPLNKSRSERLPDLSMQRFLRTSTGVRRGQQHPQNPPPQRHYSV